MSGQWVYDETLERFAYQPSEQERRAEEAHRKKTLNRMIAQKRELMALRALERSGSPLTSKQKRRLSRLDKIWG